MKISDSIGYIKKTTSGSPEAQILDEPISVYKPLTYWFGVLALAIIIELFVAPYFPALAQTMVKFSNFALYLPGSIILPLIVAIWLGERSSEVTTKVGRAFRLSMLNGVYTAVVYIVGIFIIYLIFQYLGTTSGLASVTFNNFLLYLVGIPAGILIVLTPITAVLASARKVA